MNVQWEIHSPEGTEWYTGLSLELPKKKKKKIVFPLYPPLLQYFNSMLFPLKSHKIPLTTFIASVK